MGASWATTAFILCLCEFGGGKEAGTLPGCSLYSHSNCPMHLGLDQDPIWVVHLETETPKDRALGAGGAPLSGLIREMPKFNFSS